MKVTKFNPSINSPSFFNDIFEDFFNMPSFDVGQFGFRHNNPKVNIVESEDRFTVQLAVPGITKKDIEINIENSKLLVTASKESKEEKKDTKYTRREFYYGEFKKQFTLPESINQESIEASFKNGILSIVLMKKEEAVDKGPISIDIK